MQHIVFYLNIFSVWPPFLCTTYSRWYLC